MSTEITTIRREVDLELANKETVATLVQTTFKGLKQEVMRQAIVEGMMRGFTFRDFLEKNIYAIPFSSGYSLVTSIDHARKIGMKSGIVGKLAPIYTEKEGKVVSCEVTVKRKVGNYVGDFTALVYLNEYNTGRNQWAQKPRTMIAKVAEMHALRMACPEEMSQMYSEEEMDKETTVRVLDMDVYQKKLDECTDIDSLGRTWSAIPAEAKKELESVKDELKAKLSTPVAIATQEEPSEAEEKIEINLDPITDKELAEAFGGTIVDEPPAPPKEESNAMKQMKAGMNQAKTLWPPLKIESET